MIVAFHFVQEKILDVCMLLVCNSVVPGVSVVGVSFLLVLLVINLIS